MIKYRAGWTRDGKQDPGVGAMSHKAWMEYKEVYNNELQGGASPEQAAQRALADFKSKFGTDKGKGEYAIGTAENKADSGMIGRYLNYDRTGTASTAEDL